MIKNILILVLVFLLLYLYVMENSNEFCYDLIEKKNNRYHVYNSKRELIPGLNPLIFDNLEDYKKYMEWKQDNGSDCPAIYFDRKYTTQNKLGYQLAKNPVSVSVFTLPPKDNTSIIKDNGDIRYSRDLFNSELVLSKSHYPGFDPTDQDIGKKNKIDMKF